MNKASTKTARLGRRIAEERTATTSHAEWFLFPLALVTVAAAMLLGGAGVRYPVLSGIIELLAVALLWSCVNQPPAFAEKPGGLLRITLWSIIVVPLLQIVPLPPSWWLSLPGGSEAGPVLQAAGIPLGMRPLSLTPDATIQSALALLPGVAVFGATLRLSQARRLKLLYVILAVAVLSAVLGALQRATGGDEMFLPYSTEHAASGPGLFVNRNHQAAFLLACMPLASVLGRMSGANALSRYKLASLGLIILFAGGAIVTMSRMGIVLLPLALLISALLLTEPRLSLRSFAIGVVIFIVLVGLAVESSAIYATLSRFNGPDIRYKYWADTLDGIRQFWPLGSGLGSFPTIFPRFEDLNNINNSRVNNAHNDYLELLFDAGIFAVSAFALFTTFLLQQAWRAITSELSGSQRITAVAALAAVMILMLHSIVDYPLRMLSCLTMFGFALGLLVDATKPRLKTKGPAEADPSGKRA